MLPIKIIAINKSVEKTSKDVVKVLNNNQKAFFYEIVEDKEIVNKIENWEYIHTNELYPLFENLRKGIKGYSPNLLGITDKPLGNNEYQNLFGDLQKHNGISLGNGVITTFQVKKIIKEIPIEAYLMYELILCPLLTITRTNLFHDEKRICPFDRKVSKVEIFDVLKYSTLCMNCLTKVRGILNRTQLNSMRSIFPLISDLSNLSLSLSEVLNTKIEIEELITEQIDFSLLRKLIAENKLKKAIEHIEDDKQTLNQNINNELALLNMKISSLNRDARIGTISNTDSSLEKVKITVSLLELITLMEKEI